MSWSRMNEVSEDHLNEWKNSLMILCFVFVYSDHHRMMLSVRITGIMERGIYFLRSYGPLCVFWIPFPFMHHHVIPLPLNRPSSLSRVLLACTHLLFSVHSSLIWIDEHQSKSYLETFLLSDVSSPHPFLQFSSSPDPLNLPQHLTLSLFPYWMSDSSCVSDKKHSNLWKKILDVLCISVSCNVCKGCRHGNCGFFSFPFILIPWWCGRGISWCFAW